MERLKAARFPRGQAKAEAETFAEVPASAEPLTKDYVDYRRQTELEGLHAQVASTKADLVNRRVGLPLAQAALVATLINLP